MSDDRALNTLYPLFPVEPVETDAQVPPTTPIQSLDAGQERALLDSLSVVPYDVVLVASDLHLGTGCDPVSGCYSNTENFFEGGAFTRWLTATAPSEDARGLLVLNGDTFDFLRVTPTPKTHDDFTGWQLTLARLRYTLDIGALTEAIDKAEGRYGLKTNDYKTIWKFERIVEGHHSFFDALSSWLSDGHTLVFVKGNHDLELFWPLVRLAIRDALFRHGSPPNVVESQVAFADESVKVANIYIEHGHQYEAMTQVRGSPVLAQTPEINLPLGSFMNRYIINKIERLDPFLDNVKPVQSAILTLLRRYPVSVFGTYLRSWKFIWKAIRSRKVLNGAVLTIAAALFVPLVALAIIIISYAWPDLMDRITNAVPWLQHKGARRAGAITGLLFPFLLPYLLGAGGELLRQLRRAFRRGKDDPYMAAARAAIRNQFPEARAPEVVYAVFGHTHVQRIALLTAAPRREFYLNSGTWTALWSRDRPDLLGRTLRTFLRFDRRSAVEFKHASLLWDDSAGQPRTPVLFGDFDRHAPAQLGSTA